MTDQRTPVLLYDGTCGLCNGVVRLLLRIDRKGRLRFAPLQSSPAQDYLRSEGLPTADFDSLVLVPDWERRVPGARLLRTDGAMAAFAEAGGAGRALAWLRFVPAVVRDAAYRLVSKSRFAIFGEYKPRALPNPEWEGRFIAR
jgi:predicted DCC family thiol-disulfide oxidoreductase YuxK